LRRKRMTPQIIRNDMGLVIGYVEEYPHKIDYRNLTYGIIAYYDKQTKIYYRWRQVPGKPQSTMYGDMGIADLRYWDGK
jgi:hypothetical protein